MPQRFLRPGLITSKRWESVSWTAQSFYIRLLTLVDDFGRYEADATLLRSHAFPLRDDIRSSRVTELCEEVAKAGLVTFYVADEKPYLQIEKWQERSRSDTSKFPAAQDSGSVLLFGVPQESAADGSGTPPPKSSPSINSHRPKSSPSPVHAVLIPLGLQVDEFMTWWGKWLEHLKGKRKQASIHTQELQLGKLADMGAQRAIDALKHSIENGWQGIYERKPEMRNGHQTQAPKPQSTIPAKRL